MKKVKIIVELKCEQLSSTLTMNEYNIRYIRDVIYILNFLILGGVEVSLSFIKINIINNV